jgi:hypothetical protein
VINRNVKTRKDGMRIINLDEEEEKKKEIVEIQEEVRILQDDQEIILEKGDKIQILKENNFDLENLIDQTISSMEGYYVGSPRGETTEFILDKPFIQIKRDTYEFCGLDKISHRNIAFPITKKSIEIKSVDHGFYKIKGNHPRGNFIFIQLKLR